MFVDCLALTSHAWAFNHIDEHLIIYSQILFLYSSRLTIEIKNKKQLFFRKKRSFCFFFPWPHLGMWEFPGQGLHPGHSSSPSCYSDNARSLTCCTTKNSQKTDFFFVRHGAELEKRVCANKNLVCRAAVLCPTQYNFIFVLTPGLCKWRTWSVMKTAPSVMPCTN